MIDDKEMVVTVDTACTLMPPTKMRYVTRNEKHILQQGFLRYCDSSEYEWEDVPTVGSV